MRDKDIDTIIMLDSQKTLEEVTSLCQKNFPNGDISTLEYVFYDTIKLFSGDFEGYKACNTQYHDLDHTLSVFLTTARLIDGVILSGITISHKSFILALVAALFHDAGFIQTDDDQTGTGAKYTLGHELRSIDFSSNYLKQKGFTSEDYRDCGHMIQSTMLSIDVDSIPFRSFQIETMAKIVASADLLAQMADRKYLEKLLFLYKEFKEAGINSFESELQLLEKTEDFYTQLSRKRLDHSLSGLARHIKLHFKIRHNIDEDLYQISIDRNRRYLQSLLTEHQANYRQMLRRGDLINSLEGKIDTEQES